VAKKRVATLHDRGLEDAYLYGAGDAGDDQLAGGLGAFFLLTQPPERFGLPAQADSPIQENAPQATAAGLAAAGVAIGATIASFVFAHRASR
jgi:formate dehydrogenase iron-sulfur subunit